MLLLPLLLHVQPPSLPLAVHHVKDDGCWVCQLLSQTCGFCSTTPLVVHAVGDGAAGGGGRVGGRGGVAADVSAATKMAHGSPLVHGGLKFEKRQHVATSVQSPTGSLHMAPAAVLLAEHCARAMLPCPALQSALPGFCSVKPATVHVVPVCRLRPRSSSPAIELS